MRTVRRHALVALLALAAAPSAGAQGRPDAATLIAAFAVGGWVGTRLDGTVFALTNGIWFWSVCIAIVAWTWVQRDGDPSSAWHATPHAINADPVR